MPGTATIQNELFDTQPSFEQLYDFSHLYRAYQLARKSKRYRSAVAAFSLNLERNLLLLAEELRLGSYVPGPYRIFRIYEMKPRKISAAPFRDRVVHHALMLLLSPLIEQRLQPFCYACRKDKGVHQAVSHYQQLAQNARYVLKIDVQKYFPSISNELLYQTLNTLVADTRLQHIVQLILASTGSSKGLPIGNLTSQSFANLFLADIDDWLAKRLGVLGVVRYVDDYFIFSCSRQHLWAVLAELSLEFSAKGLFLRDNLSQVFPVGRKVPVLGYQVSVTRRWLKGDNAKSAMKRFRRLSKQRRCGQLTFNELRPKVHAWIGHARHGETEGLRKHIFSSLRW